MRPWKDEEISFLKKNWGKLSKQELIDGLGKSWNAILKKKRQLGLPPVYYPPKPREKPRVIVNNIFIDCKYKKHIGEAYSGQKLYKCTRFDYQIGEYPEMCRTCEHGTPRKRS